MNRHRRWFPGAEPCWRRWAAGRRRGCASWRYSRSPPASTYTRDVSDVMNMRRDLGGARQHDTVLTLSSKMTTTYSRTMDSKVEWAVMLLVMLCMVLFLDLIGCRWSRRGSVRFDDVLFTRGCGEFRVLLFRKESCSRFLFPRCGAHLFGGFCTRIVFVRHSFFWQAIHVLLYPRRRLIDSSHNNYNSTSTNNKSPVPSQLHTKSWPPRHWDCCCAASTTT